MRRAGAIAACALAAGLASADARAQECVGWGAGVQRGELASGELVEASGLAVAWAEDGGERAFWSHNDSGDGPFLYAFDATGADLGTWRVTGASARDWEDMARGRCGDATCLYVADFGNNDEDRDDLAIWRVIEPPRPDDAPSGEPIETATAQKFTLRYDFADGANPDAESLWVDATDGALYMATKEANTARVLRLELADGVASPTEVGAFDLARATGAAGSAQGAFVMRNYFRAFMFLREDGERVEDALAREPVSVRLRSEGQAEALAIAPDGAVWTVSEGEGSPINEYPCVEYASQGGGPPDAGAGAGVGGGTAPMSSEDMGGGARDVGVSGPGEGGAPSSGCASAGAERPLGALALALGFGVFARIRRERVDGE